MKIIVFFGPPGSGKGTQAQNITQNYSLTILSTGHLLRQEIANQTSIGKKIENILAAGGLVEDEIIMPLIQKWYDENKDHYEYALFDGFPRTLTQAVYLDEHQMTPQAVHVFQISDQEIIDRLSGRRVHLKSGRTYHITAHPPVNEGKDDLTGETLVQRPDDAADAILNRLKIYHKQTAPLQAYYKKLSDNHVCAYYEHNAGLPEQEVFDSLRATFSFLR